MTKFKLAFLASAVLMATNVQANWQGNFLLGVSAGGAWHNNDDFFNVSFTEPDAFATFAVNDDGDDSHFIWGFLAGYQGRCDNWLAGLEVNVDWRGSDDDDVNFALQNSLILTPIVGTVHRDRDPVIGITGRLGYNVLPCLMPYIRLGIDYSQREYELTAVQTAGIIGPAGSFGVNSDNSKWGFVGGAGLEWFMPMIAGLSLRAEWDFHTRNHDDDTAVITIAGTESVVGISGLAQRHEQSARASLVYNF
ncbi:MAG: outer membrane beta-barrel protein [Proteobacteria bacterium]|nr:outer membrane beta-barrel protein [Pseudomonadota bacterium]